MQRKAKRKTMSSNECPEAQEMMQLMMDEHEAKSISVDFSASDELIETFFSDDEIIPETKQDQEEREIESKQIIAADARAESLKKEIHQEEVKQAKMTVATIANFLMDECKKNEAKPRSEDKESPFNMPKKPNLSLENYLNHMLEYGLLEHSDKGKYFIIMLIFLGHYQSQNNITLRDTNIYRLCATSLCTAIKMYSDKVYTNAYMAKVVGISNDQLNKLELDFFFNSNLSMNKDEESLDLQKIIRLK